MIHIDFREASTRSPRAPGLPGLDCLVALAATNRSASAALAELLALAGFTPRRVSGRTAIEEFTAALDRPTRPFRRDDLLRELHASLYPDLSARAAAEVICREASRYETTAFKRGTAEPTTEPLRTIHDILISTGKTFPAKRTVRRALGQGS